MNKKNKIATSLASGSAVTQHAAEYKAIKRDLIAVALLNAVYLGLVLTVYFTNKNGHYLERFLGNWVNL
jgi:hypothetical protein